MKRKSMGYIILITKIILLFLVASGIESAIQLVHNDTVYIIDIIKNIDNVDATKIETSHLYKILLLQFSNYCITGTIFGIEKVICERKRSGNWRINLTRLITFGVPSFIIGISGVLSIMFKFTPYVAALKPINFNLFTNFMQMFFGYTIITSFYKTGELK